MIDNAHRGGGEPALKGLIVSVQRVVPSAEEKRVGRGTGLHGAKPGAEIPGLVEASEVVPLRRVAVPQLDAAALAQATGVVRVQAHGLVLVVDQPRVAAAVGLVLGRDPDLTMREPGARGDLDPAAVLPGGRADGHRGQAERGAGGVGTPQLVPGDAASGNDPLSEQLR